MRRGRVFWTQKLVVRLLISYLLMPLLGPVLMLAQEAGHMDWGDWNGIVILYWMFGLAAITRLIEDSECGRRVAHVTRTRKEK